MKLWLIRHAKSDWNAGTRSDFLRPLNERGERDGPRMQAWLASQSDAAGWIVTSDAARARATAMFVAAGFDAARPTLIEDHRLYQAAPETLLDVARETPAEHLSLALIAHNPGMSQLVNLLVGDEVVDTLATFGVARLDVPGSWEDLRYGSATLELIMSPRRLAQGSLD